MVYLMLPGPCQWYVAGIAESEGYSAQTTGTHTQSCADHPAVPINTRGNLEVLGVTTNLIVAGAAKIVGDGNDLGITDLGRWSSADQIY